MRAAGQRMRAPYPNVERFGRPSVCIGTVHYCATYPTTATERRCEHPALLYPIPTPNTPSPTHLNTLDAADTTPHHHHHHYYRSGRAVPRSRLPLISVVYCPNARWIWRVEVGGGEVARLGQRGNGWWGCCWWSRSGLWIPCDACVKMEKHIRLHEDISTPLPPPRWEANLSSPPRAPPLPKHRPRSHPCSLALGSVIGWASI